MKVCIDPGHGGHDPGATAPDGTREADVVLPYARSLASELLRAGHGSLLTRTSNDFVGLSERAQIADDWGADAMVSFHVNAAGNSRPNGVQVFYDDRSPQALGPVLARLVWHRLAEIPGLADEDPDVEVWPDRTAWVGYKNLTVISETNCPSVLIELGFMTSPEDLAQLKDTETLRPVVLAVRDALLEFAGEVVLPPRQPSDTNPTDDPAPYTAPRIDPTVAPRHAYRAPVAEVAETGEAAGELSRRVLDGAVALLGPFARAAWAVVRRALLRKLEEEVAEL